MPRRNIDRFIGGYQIVAGSAGILATLFFNVTTLSSGTTASRLLIAVAAGAIMAVFAGVVLAGVLLLEGHPAGRILSSGVQLLQVPIFAAASVHWLFFAGAYLGLAWFDDQPRLDFGLKAELEVAWAGVQPVTGYGINVIPLILLGLLWRPPPVPAVPEEPGVGVERPVA